MTNEKKCHPERSISQLYRGMRSRRTCGLLVALAGLAATPASNAACLTAQSTPILHWDPVLHHQWVITTDCSHPERPAQSKLTFSPIPHPQNITRPGTPLVVRAGDRIRLWSQQSNTRIELTGIAEESGVIGATVNVRLTQPISSEIEPELQGIVRGPSEVEFQR